jgi:hypothetical protein
LQDWWHFAGNSMALRLNRFVESRLQSLLLSVCLCLTLCSVCYSIMCWCVL